MQRLIPALLFAILAFSSCTKSDTDDQQKLLNDQWYITEFEVIDQGTLVPYNIASNFTGYTFEFNDNDEWVVRKPNGTASTGKWGNVNVNGGSAFGIKMDNATAPLDALVGNWKVIEQTDVNIYLEKNSLSTSTDNYAGSKVYFKKQ